MNVDSNHPADHPNPRTERYADPHPLGGGLVLLHPENDDEWLWGATDSLVDLEVWR